MVGPRPRVLAALARGALACGAAACGVFDQDPELRAIEPPTVGPGVATPAVVRGERLFAVGEVNLDDLRPARLDHGWRLRIGDLVVPEADVIWRDPTQVDLIIPPVLQVGIYDVFATGPSGRELVLPQALTVEDGSLTRTPEGPLGDPSCADGLDNDGDMLTDDADPGCGPNTPPLPAIQIRPPAGTMSTAFVADATGTLDREDAAGALTYDWDWDGDGAFDAVGVTATQTFATPGEHVVTLRARDTGGLAGYATFTVVVSPAVDLIVVTTGVDESDFGATPVAPGGTGLSLREAARFATATPGQQTVLVPAGTIVALTSQLLDQNDNAGVWIVGDGAVIDGSAIPGSASSCFDIPSNNNRLYGLEIRNCGGWPIYIHGTATANRVARCSIHDNGYGVELEGDLNTLGPANELRANGASPGVTVTGKQVIEHNRFLDQTGGPGVRLMGTADGTLVLGNVFLNCASAFVLEANANNVVIWHNTIHASAGDGISVASNLSGTDVRNNVVSGSTGWGISGRAGNFEELNYNDYVGNALGVCNLCVGVGTNSLQVDPLFMDTATFDLRLQPGSPVIDGGADLGVDINGAAPGAFNGASPDLGAWEAP